MGSGEVKALVRETLDEVIEPIVYEEALDLIDSHRAAGPSTYSSCPRHRQRSLGRSANISASKTPSRHERRSTAMVATPVKSSSMRTAPTKPKHPRDAITEDLDLAESFAYSDSITDLPMLEAVGHPVVVNPDRELRRIAVERGWEIRTFTATVALKDAQHRPARRDRQRDRCDRGSGGRLVVVRAARQKTRRFASWR